MKNGIDNMGNERFYSFFTVDLPIRDAQLDKLRDELQEHFDCHADDFERWVWDTCEGVDHDGYGSFRFEWPADVMNFLKEYQRERMEEIVNEAVANTFLAESMCVIKNTEFEDDYCVEGYLQAIVDAGYTIDLDYELEIIPEEFHDVAKAFVAQQILSGEVA